MKSNQVKSLYYNPYFGNYTVEEIKRKENKYNAENSDKYEKKRSLLPKDLLNDASYFIFNSFELLQKSVPLEELLSTNNLKGLGTIIIIVSLVLFFFTNLY